jgi:hypothetical protein
MNYLFASLNKFFKVNKLLPNFDKKNFVKLVGFEVLTAVIMKSYIFWDMMSYSSLKVGQRFGGTCCLNLQGQRINQARNQR